MASIAGAAFELRPMTLLDETGARSLDFEEPGGKKRSHAEILPNLARRGGTPVPRARPAGISVVETAAAELTGMAEMGCRAIGRSGSRRLAEVGAQAERMGLRGIAETLAELAATDRSLASQLLISRYIVDQTRLRLTTLPMLWPY